MASKKKWKAPFGIEATNWVVNEGYTSGEPAMLHWTEKNATSYYL